MIIGENAQINGNLNIWTSATITSSGIVSADTFRDYTFTGGLALVSDSNKNITESIVTSAQINYLNTTSANIQTQFNNLSATDSSLSSRFGSYLPLSGGTMTGSLTVNDRQIYFNQANGLRFGRSGDGTSVQFFTPTSGTRGFLPGTTSASQNGNLGNGTYRWLGIYSQDGDFVNPIKISAYSGSKVLVSDSSKFIQESSLASSALTFLNTVSADIQTQLTNLSATKANSSQLTAYLPLSGGTLTGNLNGTNISADTLAIGNITNTEFGYLDTVSANIQTQFNDTAANKLGISAATLQNYVHIATVSFTSQYMRASLNFSIETSTPPYAGQPNNVVWGDFSTFNFKIYTIDALSALLDTGRLTKIAGDWPRTKCYYIQRTQTSAIHTYELWAESILVLNDNIRVRLLSDNSDFANIQYVLSSSPTPPSGTKNYAVLGGEIATSTNNGMLTSADWNIFNNKIGSLSALNSYLPLSGGTLTGNLNGSNISANNISASTISDSTFTGSKVLVSNGKAIDESSITTTQLNYLSGTSSNIQNQLSTLSASDSLKANASQLTAYLPLSGGTLTGNLNVGNATTSAILSLNSQISSGHGIVQFQKNSITRTMLRNEPTNNTFTFEAYDSAGNYIDTPISYGNPANSPFFINRPLRSSLISAVDISASTISNLSFAGSKALVSNGKAIGESTTTITELSYLSGTSANIQNQLIYLSANNVSLSVLSNYLPLSGGILTGSLSGTNISANNISANNITNNTFAGSRAVVTDAAKKIIESSVTSTEVSYLSTVSANIQTQLNQLKQQSLSGLGTGTVNRLTKFVTTSSVGNASITDTGSLVSFTTSVSSNADITAPTFTGLASRATSALASDTLKTARAFSLSGNIFSTNVPTFNGSGNIVINTSVSAIPWNTLTSVPTASTNTSGVLTSSDWNTFNNKVSNLNSLSAYLPLSGGTLTGELIFNDDGEGITTFGGGRFYKKSVTGLVTRLHNGNTRMQVEDNSGLILGTYWDSGNLSALSQLTNTPGYVTSAIIPSYLNNYLPLSGGTMTGDIISKKIYVSANGVQNVFIGDDSSLGDVNTANTLGISGQQNNNQAYIKFSNDVNLFGYDGIRLSYGGNFALANISADSISDNNFGGGKVVITVNKTLEESSITSTQLGYLAGVSESISATQAKLNRSRVGDFTYSAEDSVLLSARSSRGINFGRMLNTADAPIASQYINFIQMPESLASNSQTVIATSITSNDNYIGRGAWNTIPTWQRIWTSTDFTNSDVTNWNNKITKTGDTGIGSLRFSVGSRLSAFGGIIPSATSNYNYINAPFVTARTSTGPTGSDVASIGFHNIGINGSVLYYGLDGKFYYDRDTATSLIKFWDSEDFSSTNVTNWNTAYTSAHNHGNKPLLDLIDQSLAMSADVAFNQVNLTAPLYFDNSNNSKDLYFGKAALGDCGTNDTLLLQGLNDSNKGYIRFGNMSTGADFGYDGTNLKTLTPISGTSLTADTYLYAPNNFYAKNGVISLFSLKTQSITTTDTFNTTQSRKNITGGGYTITLPQATGAIESIFFATTDDLTGTVTVQRSVSDLIYLNGAAGATSITLASNTLYTIATDSLRWYFKS